MQIVKYFQAKVLHSSRAAFNLAMENNKYLSFAEKIISVKNENAHHSLIKTHTDLKKGILPYSKIVKYDIYLGCISKVKHQDCQRNELLGYSNLLPRLEVIKNNGNDHVYFLPYNNKPKNITITAFKE
ncbi:hypothetical protein [[Erwinia] mediterraneensis]|uniref:hypothetical protein n=1 Tax=[Erwinia] mediterraneensis TaxID=2161819 RepID=UPI001031CB61|nr:hypothetical protein [[Erwinia] mediterraneensis]